MHDDFRFSLNKYTTVSKADLVFLFACLQSSDNKWVCTKGHINKRIISYNIDDKKKNMADLENSKSSEKAPQRMLCLSWV